MNDTDLADRLAKRLKAARKEAKLTLEQLSQRSGVSRSMLSQIERGETNPTVATLWNLTQALGIDFSGLVEGSDNSTQEKSSIDVMPADRTPRIESQTGGYSLRILSPANMAGNMEWYELNMSPGAKLDSSAHSMSAFEHLSVLSGVLSVTSGKSTQQIRAGDTARYPANLTHSIENTGQLEAKALLFVLS